jgi:glycosyltransferase involved in cell wall biosynthesis
MATIAIVTSAPPLTEGGHLVHARALERALREAGHRAGIVTTPSNRFGRQGSAYLANWLTDVGMTGDGRPVDQIITMRFPAYAVRHPVHVCWLIHTMREYYDLWDRFSAPLSPQGRVKELARRTLIRAADTYFLKHHVTRLFTNSEAVNQRLKRWNGVSGEALLPPPPPRAYRCDEYGDYLFFYSRLSPLKRGDLLLRALARPSARGVRCVIAGDGEDRPRLEALVRELGLGDRVRFIGFLTEDDLLGHLARCRAVVFVPHQEDYGFVTAESFSSGKPVITCTDSGGPLELVRAGENGLVVAPDPDSLAAACAELTADAARAERLGARGRADVARLTWADAVRRLVIA